MSHQEHPGASEESHWKGDPSDKWVHADNDGIHISAPALKITWGNDDRFWKWIDHSKEMLPPGLSTAEPGSHNVALLVQVSWLEITGSVDLTKYKDQLSKGQNCEIIYHIKFKNDAFGWGNAPVTFLAVTTKDGQNWKKSEKLDPHRSGGTDHWHEINGVEFKLPEELAGKLEFGMFDVHSQCWKGGLFFAGVTIRPKKEH